MANAIRGLILDFGEVLTYPQPAASVVEMARLVGVAETRFTEAYWAHRRDYDLGLAADRYWARVLESCGVSPPDDGTDGRLARMTTIDAASWTAYRETMWDVAASFRGRQGRTAILSNGVPEVMTRVRADRTLERWFDAVVVSYELGVAKPSAAIYEACLARLGVGAEEALFVDDRQENIDAAARLGLHTVHFRGDSSVVVVRERLGVPLGDG